MDLEVDHRWRDAREKITDSQTSEKIPGSGWRRWEPHASDEMAMKSASVPRAKQKLSSAFWLLIALTAAIALAAIAAGVAGSIAVQRQSRLKSYELQEPICLCLNPANDTSCYLDAFRLKTF